MKCKEMTGDLRLLQLYSETKLGTKTGSSHVMCNDECTKALTHTDPLQHNIYSTIYINFSTFQTYVHFFYIHLASPLYIYLQDLK